jgi:antitoxin component YwqK of YwqJK toxin-antitoxin module
MSEIEHYSSGGFITHYDKEKTKVKEEYFKMNGKMNGIYKSYWKNGQLCTEVNYIDDIMNGIKKSYFPNGQLEEELNYIDGKKNGIYKSYWENGQLEEEVNYIDGLKQGYINHIGKMGNYIVK